jgi:tRNA threonylcarbamoyladenosine biosynthesis protein TsaE
MKEYVSKNEADTVACTLGSGKTVLTKGIARGMGIAEVITSPSFTIMNEYKGQLTLCHFDFYRIERVAEMEDLVEDYLYRTDTVVVVEWGMKLGQLINEYIQITIDIRDEYRRIVTKEHSP